MARRFRRARGRARDDRAARGRARRARFSGEAASESGELFSYEPILVDADAASRGVRSRLYVASAAAALTLACLLGMALGGQGTFAMIALGSMAFGGLLATLTLVLSARREEVVHQLASDLDRQPPLLPGAGGADGDP